VDNAGLLALQRLRSSRFQMTQCDFSLWELASDLDANELIERSLFFAGAAKLKGATPLQMCGLAEKIKTLCSNGKSANSPKDQKFTTTLPFRPCEGPSLSRQRGSMRRNSTPGVIVSLDLSTGKQAPLLISPLRAVSPQPSNRIGVVRKGSSPEQTPPAELVASIKKRLTPITTGEEVEVNGPEKADSDGFVSARTSSGGSWRDAGGSGAQAPNAQPSESDAHLELSSLGSSEGFSRASSGAVGAMGFSRRSSGAATAEPEASPPPMVPAESPAMPVLGRISLQGQIPSLLRQLSRLSSRAAAAAGATGVKVAERDESKAGEEAEKGESKDENEGDSDCDVNGNGGSATESAAATVPEPRELPLLERRHVDLPWLSQGSSFSSFMELPTPVPTPVRDLETPATHSPLFPQRRGNTTDSPTLLVRAWQRGNVLSRGMEDWTDPPRPLHRRSSEFSSSSRASSGGASVASCATDAAAPAGSPTSFPPSFSLRSSSPVQHLKEGAELAAGSPMPARAMSSLAACCQLVPVPELPSPQNVNQGGDSFSRKEGSERPGGILSGLIV